MWISGLSVAFPSVSSQNNPNHVTVTASPSRRPTDSKLELARSTFPSAVINFKNWYLRKVGENFEKATLRRCFGGNRGSQVSLVTGWARVFVGGVKKHSGSSRESQFSIGHTSTDQSGSIFQAAMLGKIPEV